MLQFEFQLLHPLTQTLFFSLKNQSANYLYDQQKSVYVFNKLICNTTVVPFNMAIVRFKWNFFREQSGITDGTPSQQSGFPPGSMALQNYK